MEYPEDNNNGNAQSSQAEPRRPQMAGSGVINGLSRIAIHRTWWGKIKVFSTPLHRLHRCGPPELRCLRQRATKAALSLGCQRRGTAGQDLEI